MEYKELIESGKTALGIELGSTRIKGVLIDYDGNVIATGFYDWENSLVDGIWTYSIEQIDAGIRGCYTSLRKAVEEKYGVTPKTYGAMGISAMMHGYMAVDKDGRQIAPFQTWRNTNTQQAADELTELFNYNIYVSTLSGYIHRKLTGERVLGIGDAVGMFPIDSEKLDYNEEFVQKFDKLIEKYHFSWKLRDVFPKVLVAGQDAGHLTPEGAAYLDESGNLQPGVPLCPPEGDAGTGMVATNSVAPRTGNVSAGTSTFAMVVLEKQLSSLHREIDMVTTPTGFPCAMSHANNGTSDLNAWVSIFSEFCDLMGIKADTGELFSKLYTNSLKGDPDCGGLLPYGYYSGENVTMINEGRLVFLRTANSKFMDILMKDEGVKIEKLYGHGGLFKTKGVAQRYLSASVGVPVTVMDTANEGGAWGIALLAAFLADGKGSKLEDYLNERIFSRMSGTTIAATQEEIDGYEVFAERYKKGLDVERAAIKAMDWD